MTEEEWTFAISEDELQDGVPVSVKMGKKKVLLVRREGRIHACGGKCTHYGAPLEDGLLRDDTLTCPWHNARFDVTTGEMLAPPALDDVGCRPVRVEDGDVYVGPAGKTSPAGRKEGDDRTFVIVGGGAAGNAAAETLRREGFGGRVVLVTREADRPYDRPSLSKEFMSGEAPSSWIPLHGPDFYEERDIELMTEREVTELDPDGRTLHFADGETMQFDKLLCATGAVPKTLDLEGADLPGYFLLRSFGDARSILDRLEGAENAVVLGAGFIGMEVAAALAERGLAVHVVAPEDAPMSRVFGPEIGRWLQGLHAEHGVTFHMNATARRLVGDGRVEEVELSEGERLPAGVVVAGLGVRPAVEWLRAAGIVEDGEVPVDEHLRTAAEDVYAAGDIARVPAPLTGGSHRVEHWVVAERQGQHAARCMLGSHEPYREIPFFWTMQFGTPLKYLGYPVETDRVAFRGDVADGDFLAGYYRDSQLVAVAAAGRAREAIACGELLKACRNVEHDTFVDENTDLVAMIG